MITMEERFIGSKVQRFFNSSHDLQVFIGTFGEPQNPKNLQNPFMLSKSYQVPLFLKVTALPIGGDAVGRGGCSSGNDSMLGLLFKV